MIKTIAYFLLIFFIFQQLQSQISQQQQMDLSVFANKLFIIDHGPNWKSETETEMILTWIIIVSGVMSQNIWGAQSLRGSEATKPEGA